jgi:hypothetical protein
MVKTLDQLYASSAGRCPAFNVDLNLELSRYCPLACECWKVTQKEYLGLPFDCRNYRAKPVAGVRPSNQISPCPIENEMINLALQEVL